jgi:hypothetical protein
VKGGKGDKICLAGPEQRENIEENGAEEVSYDESTV